MAMKKKPLPNPPGRPRKFVEKEALDAAVAVFADKGYEGASLDDLTGAMGINRVSMYATFGNKEALFRKAMERFSTVQGKHLATCLSAPTARAAVESLLRTIVIVITRPDGPGVCFITQPPLTAEDTSEETRRFVALRRKDIERGLQRRLEQGIKAKGLPRGASAGDLARYYALLLQGLALQVQHGATKDQLMRVVDVAMAAFPK